MWRWIIVGAGIWVAAIAFALLLLKGGGFDDDE